MEPKLNEWYEISEQKDINDLLDFYYGFHDSCIASLHFVSGMYTDDKHAMRFGRFDECELSIMFHSQWNDDALELRFAGLRRLHLVGVQDNHFSDIFDASIKFYDNLLPSGCSTPSRVIVWADRENFDINKDIDAKLIEPADTYVVAHSLKWRLVEKN